MKRNETDFKKNKDNFHKNYFSVRYIIEIISSTKRNKHKEIPTLLYLLGSISFAKYLRNYIVCYE